MKLAKLTQKEREFLGLTEPQAKTVYESESVNNTLAAQLENIKKDINTSQTVKRGDIYFTTTSKEITGITHVQLGGRPVVIVSNDIGNTNSGIVICVPLTTKEKRPLPTHVKINSIKNKSTAMCEQIFTIDQFALDKYIGHATAEEMRAIDEALKVSIAIEGADESQSILQKWSDMYRINYTGSTPVIEEVTKVEAVTEPIKTAEGSIQIVEKVPDDYLIIKAELEVYKRVYGDMIGIFKMRGL